MTRAFGGRRTGPTRTLNLSLVSRNVTVGGKRTSLRLEDYFWKGLSEICAALGRKRDDVMTTIDRDRYGIGLTSAVRVFILSYYRTQVERPLATPEELLAAALAEVDEALANALRSQRPQRDTSPL